MAFSQRDMFLNSSPESSPKLSSSLPSNLTYTYLWCILFDWDENTEFPFQIYQVGSFPKVELKPQWISGELDQDSRLKKLKFPSYKGKTFSLFAKIEKCKFNKKHLQTRISITSVKIQQKNPYNNKFNIVIFFQTRTQNGEKKLWIL